MRRASTAVVEVLHRPHSDKDALAFRCQLALLSPKGGGFCQRADREAGAARLYMPGSIPSRVFHATSYGPTQQLSLY